MGPKSLVSRFGKEELSSGLLAVAVFLNTVTYDFVYDDRKAILTNPSVVGELELSTLLSTDFWGVPLDHSGSHKSFRPLTTLLFRLDWLLNASSVQFHVTNIILHGIATVWLELILIQWILIGFEALLKKGLVVRFCKLLLSSQTAWLAGAIFAVHPIHTEAVAGIVGRAEILCSIFYLCCLLYHHHHGWTPCTLVLAGASLLAKEQGITVLPVCAAMDVLSKQDSKSIRRSLLKIGLSAVCLVSLRSLALKGGLPYFSTSDNPAAKSDSLLTRTLTFAYLAVLNLFMIACPVNLSYDWSMDAIPLVKSLCDIRNCFTLLTLSVFTTIAIKLYPYIQSKLSNIVIKSELSKKPTFRCENNNIIPPHDFIKKYYNNNKQEKDDNKVIVIAMILLVIGYLPASNLLVYVGFVIAERVLYLPSIGYAMLLAFSIQQLISRFPSKKEHIKLATLLLLTTFSLRTVLRNQVWRNEESLYKSGLAINPAKSWSNYANILSTSLGDKSTAELAFKEALLHRSNMADTHYNLGILLQEQQRYKEAITYYEQSIKLRPGLGFAYLNLGLALTQLGDTSKAIDVFRKGVDVTDVGIKDPTDNIEARAASSLNLGRLLLEHGDRNGALTILHEAVNKTAPKIVKTGSGIREKLYNQLGEVYTQLGNIHEAEKWYLSSLNANPNHLPAHLTLAKLVAKNNSRLDEAERILKRAIAINPSSSSANAHYGLFLLDRNRFQEATEKFSEAVANDPFSYDYVFNLGVAARLAGHLDLAENSYRRAVELRPTEAEPHLNLGAMLHLRGKLQEAETQYLEAWSIQPGHANVKINLERLHNIMRKKEMKIRDIVE